MAFFFSPVASGLVNVTVDDQLGDRTTGLIPEYLPNDGTWHVGSPTEDCPTCKIKPSTFDLSQIHEQTWHDATHTPPLTPATITVHFNGSAVYVYNILPNTIVNTTTFVNISFSINGEDVGTFTRSPDSSSTILYNQLVYRNVTLDDGPHTLLMTAGGDSKALFLFDYLLYTTQGNDSTSSNTPISSAQPTSSSTTSNSPPPSTSSSSAPVGAIVGGVVGGVVILLGIVAVLLLLRRRTMHSGSSTRVGGTAYRGEGGENHGFLAQPASTGSYFPSYSEPSMRSPHGVSVGVGVGVGVGSGSSNSYSPNSESEYAVSGTDPYPPGPSLDAAAQAGRGETPSTDQWSSKRRAELTRRLESLQRTRSVLSSASPYSTGSVAPSGVSSGAIEELEAEIAELRGVLVTLSARLADRDEHDRGPRESLPAYAE